MFNVSIGLAFLAGLVSFFSPCVFSLVPAYIGYLGGRTLVSEGSERSREKTKTFFHGLAFITGFSFVFISLGIAFSAVSQFFYDTRDVLSKIGGVIILVFGLHMTGWLKLPFLDFDLRPDSKLGQGRSLFSSFLMGILFSAGWSPCVGPTLGLILTLALDRANILQGITLLSLYSLGMAVPFAAAALGIGWVMHILKKYDRVLHITQVVMGVILMIVGVMLFLGIYQQMISFDALIDFGL